MFRAASSLTLVLCVAMSCPRGTLCDGDVEELLRVVVANSEAETRGFTLYNSAVYASSDDEASAARPPCRCRAAHSLKFGALGDILNYWRHRVARAGCRFC
jgi:hypothetical protein